MIMMENTERVIESDTITKNIFLLHKQGYGKEQKAINALRLLSRERGRDLRYDSEIREGTDGLYRIYERVLDDPAVEMT